MVKEDVSGGCGGHGGGPTLPRPRKTAARPAYVPVRRQESAREPLSAAQGALFACSMLICAVLLILLVAAGIFIVLWIIWRIT